MHKLLQDLRAARSTLPTSGFYAIAVMTLALVLAPARQSLQLLTRRCCAAFLTNRPSGSITFGRARRRKSLRSANSPIRIIRTIKRTRF